MIVRRFKCDIGCAKFYLYQELVLMLKGCVLYIYGSYEGKTITLILDETLKCKLSAWNIRIVRNPVLLAKMEFISKSIREKYINILSDWCIVDDLESEVMEIRSLLTDLLKEIMLKEKRSSEIVSRLSYTLKRA